ncbi:response regulator [Candidatus Sulfurimonas marisnigri]|uniref:histidine kinase n=1 Tax=Candidatus Sulfurimonas marisnigri TaxID=2740405 RepID=A0A7S7M186_9BACT|nr:response regulator [Candidatus Sulfurimonas marisnigri]QOY55266.1 response regulator [Candidatus Sulfurimonas marisnigri]
MKKNNNKFNIAIFIVVIVVMATVLIISSQIKNKQIKEMVDSNYEKITNNIHKEVALFVKDKKESTMAIALALSINQNIIDSIINNKPGSVHLDNFSRILRNNTKYENVWFHVVTKDGISFYKSWVKKKGEDIRGIRLDIASLLKKPKITSTISVGKFDMTFKSIVPIYDGKKFIGIIEIISKFNSIAKKLLEDGLETVILADKKYKKQLTKAFSKKFIDDYYVANLDAKEELLKIIKSNGVSKYINKQEQYSINHENNYLSTTYHIPDIYGNPMGYVIVFKSLKTIDMKDIENLEQNSFIYLVSILVGLLILGSFFISRRYSRLLKNNLDDLDSKNVILKESNDNFQDLLDMTMEMIILSDENQKIIDINKAGVTVLGYKNKSEIIGKNILDFVLESELEKIKEALKHDSVEAYELTLVKKDLTPIPTLSSSLNIINNKKTIRINTLFDLTQVREKDLLLTNELNRTIKSNEKQVWIKDGLSTLNEKLTGDISVADVSKIAIEHLGNYLHAGVGVLYSYNHENKLLILEGTYAYIQTDDSRNTIKLGEGTIGQVALQMSPILLKDVKVSQLSINTATISQSPLNIYTFPLTYQDKLYGVVEIGSNELFTDKEIEFFNASNRVITTALSTATQNQKVKNLLEETQFVNIQMQEQQQKLEEANANMEEQQQQLEEANAQMEEQHQQLEVQNDSLLKSQNELEKKARDLTASTKYKSEFLANMSHELRTPLNSIILLSDMLQENNSNHLDENEVKKAHVINSSGNDLLKLIGDVLDLSKIEAGMMELIIDEFQSTELCDGFQVQFEEIAKQKNLTFKTVDDYKGLIKNDRDRLGQVLRNLISNSLKFTKSGSITLHVENAADNKIKISVCDTGIGIPKSKQESIFEAFQQADGGTSREYGGTGLGLSISLELIRMMHGEILLDSKENEGSAFSIIIPNIDNKESEKPKEKIEQTALHVEINDDRSALQTNDKPFLIIEDDENFANILKEKINSQGEYALISHTGTSGLALARSYNIKGVLLDLGLPDIDGIDLLKEFKTDSSLRKIPVFVISGDHRVKLTKEYGAEGYIQKPVTDSEITSVIQEIKNSDDEIHEFMSRVNIQSTTNAKESVDLTGKKVLVVDDDIRNIYVLLEALSSKGADVITANDGQEAIDTLSTNIDVDIILMDVMMPVMDGYEAVKIIKENTKTKDIPVIAVTAKALSEDRQNALDAGYDDYITKPLQMKMLMEIICAWVEK